MVSEKKLLAKVVRAPEKAKKEFEEFEKRDLKVREDLKHNKAKIKKLNAKVGGEKKKVRMKFSLFCKINLVERRVTKWVTGGEKDTSRLFPSLTKWLESVTSSLVID